MNKYNRSMMRKRLTGRSTHIKHISSSKAAGKYWPDHYTELHCDIRFDRARLYAMYPIFIPLVSPSFPFLSLRCHPHSASSLHPHQCFFLIIILLSPSCALLCLPHIFCRYYGIAIVNSLGKKLKLPKGSVTITYQIHRYGNCKRKSN